MVVTVLRRESDSVIHRPLSSETMAARRSVIIMDGARGRIMEILAKRVTMRTILEGAG